MHIIILIFDTTGCNATVKMWLLISWNHGYSICPSFYIIAQFMISRLQALQYIVLGLYKNHKFMETMNFGICHEFQHLP